MSIELNCTNDYLEISDVIVKLIKRSPKKYTANEIKEGLIEKNRYELEAIEDAVMDLAYTGICIDDEGNLYF